MKNGMVVASPQKKKDKELHTKAKQTHIKKN
jgi:hypothetical protein